MLIHFGSSGRVASFQCFLNRFLGKVLNVNHDKSMPGKEKCDCQTIMLWRNKHHFKLSECCVIG